VSTQQPTSYRAFIVRLWRTSGGMPHGIRISVQDIHGTDDRLFFSVDSLSEYLEEKAREPNSGDERGRAGVLPLP
jgi:hypothetical protein